MAMNLQLTGIGSETSFPLSDSSKSCRSCIDYYIYQIYQKVNQKRTVVEYLLSGLNRFKFRPRVGIVAPTRPEGRGSPVRMAISSSVGAMRNRKLDE